MSGVYVTKTPVYGKAFMDTVLGAMKTLPGAALIVGAKVRLSKDPGFSPSPQSTIAALAASECDFTGYPAGGDAVAVGTLHNLSPNSDGFIQDALFSGSGGPPFTGGSAYGYWIDDGTNVIMGEAFGSAGPINITVAGDYIELDLRLPLRFEQPVM